MKGVKYPKLILNKHEYVVLRKTENKTRWRCAYVNKKKCNASLVTTGKQVVMGFDHNHPPLMENQLFESALSQNVTIIKRPKFKF